MIQSSSSLPDGCRLGSVTFLQRFGKALNPHFHFHCCIIDGLFDKQGNFYEISPKNIHSVQEIVRKKVIRFFQRNDLLTPDEASDMLSWDHGGFSLNANVRIEAHDRAGLERLIRYCARPVFSSERLDRIGEKLRYTLPKPTVEGQTILLLKPSELLDKLAQLIPPPRKHRHHYHGVLAPNSPLRTKITALAGKEVSPKEASDERLPPSKEILEKDRIDQPTNVDKLKKEPSKASLFRWAMLLARLFEVFPLCCPKCNHPMRIISFIEDAHTIRKILTHINEPIEPPPISPARGPPEPEFNFDQTCEYV